ncbi:hypothetical protein [Kribbella deserti]|uniref:LPXTG cell wall anchor domain-containing protein n=1 Tax=Kribbella deserti TaxID=1926257 RepID=A0ABV6QV11_9ACTN
MRRSRVLRMAAGLAAGITLTVSMSGIAQASEGPDLGAAAKAAHSAEATRLIDKAVKWSNQRAGRTAEATPVVVQQDAVPVYALSPDFVTGRSADVASLWYVATTATKGRTTLTVFTAPQAGRWAPVNVATGNTEARMAAAARGARLFTEPQIGAWYALKAGRIHALNDTATEAIGSTPITVEAYRARVAARYADKQAGSAYDKTGAAGGYDTSAPAKAAGDYNASAPVQAATEKPAAGQALLLTAASSALLALGGVVVYRRKRTSV